MIADLRQHKVELPMCWRPLFTIVAEVNDYQYKERFHSEEVSTQLTVVVIVTVIVLVNLVIVAINNYSSTWQDLVPMCRMAPKWSPDRSLGD